MKALTLVAPILAVAALTVAIIGLKRPQPTPVPPPEQLVLTDAAGHERVRIFIDGQGGNIVLLDAQGQPRATLSEGFVAISGADARAQLSASSVTPGLRIYNAAYTADLTLHDKAAGLTLGDHNVPGRVELRVSDHESTGAYAKLELTHGTDPDKAVSLSTGANVSPSVRVGMRGVALADR